MTTAPLKRVDILEKIDVFCHKKYNTWSFWDNWLFKNFLWSEWKIVSDLLTNNAKVLLDSQTIAHVNVSVGYYRSFDDLPIVKVRSRIFDLRTGKIKEIYRYIGLSYDEAIVWDNSKASNKQDKIKFICDKTDEIVETISNFIKTIT